MVCPRYSTLDESRWMCVHHMYHKASIDKLLSADVSTIRFSLTNDVSDNKFDGGDSAMDACSDRISCVDADATVFILPVRPPCAIVSMRHTMNDVAAKSNMPTVIFNFHKLNATWFNIQLLFDIYFRVAMPPNESARTHPFHSKSKPKANISSFRLCKAHIQWSLFDCIQAGCVHKWNSISIISWSMIGASRGCVVFKYLLLYLRQFKKEEEKNYYRTRNTNRKMKYTYISIRLNDALPFWK